MLESLNGVIFQRHFPYHTVAPGWSYHLPYGLLLLDVATGWGQGSKYLSSQVITLIPLYTRVPRVEKQFESFCLEAKPQGGAFVYFGQLSSCFLFIRENYIWHYMWIVCQADDSHVMSSIISSEKYEKNNMLWECRLPVVIGA